MKNLFVAVGTVVCGLTIAAVCMAQKDPPPAASKTKVAPAQPAKAKPPGTVPDPDASTDEKAIHQLIDDVEKAYNAADAKALAAFFTDDAELVDEDGEVTHGRVAIEERFVAAFAARPGAKMSFEVESIRSIGPGLLVEDGTTTVTVSPDEPPERSRYAVVHIKQDGKW
ncbi:MAG: SgcJ/EcaC family oxidoreductase, partial [Candidatus Saccharimonas sp.]|nr:SgcJ/EcaC family oxidoreductase [Planctomycetaceae bacterium]